ncbi:hypothetical protein [Gymnodinialimonas ceratoperidinii]|uniref:Uncharacterized protein n=1 Tax=Gymnodinialimonas ceratoperidinii TaxID=2856823 RepID=A0A8F6Y9M4_9RHOB|nr:hypothetical protein [Gymnodinialimonas ceratoperidinii]QXT38708.1 hypothetical protein KYE46_12275 [Gymnodinialimonas ceratoperidinii]
MGLDIERQLCRNQGRRATGARRIRGFLDVAQRVEARGRAEAAPRVSLDCPMGKAKAGC